MSGCWISVGSGSTDERIATITAAQSTVAERGQLLAAGIKPSAIDRRLARGRLVRAHRRVYSTVPSIEMVPLAAETAALLACGLGAFLSHHSGATLWTMRPGDARPVHVTIHASRNAPTSLQGVIVHRSRTLTQADVRIHRGLPVTSPARTVLDIAATLPDRDLERVLAEAFAKRLVTRDALDAVLARAGNHPGAYTLRRVLDRGNPQSATESGGEEALLKLIRAAGLEEPETQVYVLDYRLDFFWRAKRLAVEVDTYGTHGSPAAFERDRRRDARLLAEAGIRVIRITKTQIDTEPLHVVALLARALAA